MIFGQGAVQLGIGMAVGLALALGISHVMKVVLFQVEPRDPTIFAGVALVLVVVGLFAVSSRRDGRRWSIRSWRCAAIEL